MKFERLFKTIQIITFKLYLNSRFQTFISKMYRREKKGISCVKIFNQECFKKFVPRIVKQNMRDVRIIKRIITRK